MNENQLAREIVDAAYQIHSKLGPGLFETVYEVVLTKELEKAGSVCRKAEINTNPI
jgi:GxxExxY protein